MKCKNCNNDCMKIDDPEMFSIHIPFTKFEIKIWNWNNQKEEEYCVECYIDMSNSKQKEGMDYRLSEAYNQGLEDRKII